MEPTSRITTCAIAWAGLLGVLAYLSAEKPRYGPLIVLTGGVGLVAGAVIGAAGEISRALARHGRLTREPARTHQELPAPLSPLNPTGIQTDLSPPEREGAGHT